MIATTYAAVCNAVKSAAAIGKLAGVFFDAHGDSQWISLGDEQIQNTNNFGCLSAIEPDGKILLGSCSTGAPVMRSNNIAQSMANGSKREVIAPKEPLSGVCTEISDNDVLYTNPKIVWCHSENIFQSFKPAL